MARPPADVRFVTRHSLLMIPESSYHIPFDDLRAFAIQKPGEPLEVESKRAVSQQTAVP